MLGPGAAVALSLAVFYGVASWRARSYDLGSMRGLLSLVVDHSWSLPNTLAGAVFLGVNLLRGNRIDGPASRHRTCVHLVNGVVPGYLTTIGPVIAGLHPPAHAHEHGHILQARIFGPLYLPLVAVHYVIVTLLPYWLFYHDHERFPLRGMRAYLHNGVYRHVWHEVWCYARYGPQ